MVGVFDVPEVRVADGLVVPVAKDVACEPVPVDPRADWSSSHLLRCSSARRVRR